MPTIELKMSIKLDKEFLDNTRKEHYLAREMSDDELIRFMHSFADEVNDNLRFQLLLDNLDYFNV